MKQAVWFRFLVNVVVSMVIFGGAAFGHPVEGRRKVVVFQKGTSGQVRQQMAKQAGARVLHNLPIIDGVAIELPAGRAPQALKALQRNRAVVGVYNDYVIGADHVVSMTPVEPPAAELFPWGVDRIGTPLVADLVTSLSVSRPTVAVVDSGID